MYDVYGLVVYMYTYTDKVTINVCVRIAEQIVYIGVEQLRLRGDPPSEMRVFANDRVARVTNSEVASAVSGVYVLRVRLGGVPHRWWIYKQNTAFYVQIFVYYISTIFFLLITTSLQLPARLSIAKSTFIRA